MNSQFIEEKNIAEALCEKGIHFCTFLETPFEDSQQKIAGIFPNFPEFSSKLNYFKNLNQNSIENKCTFLNDKLPDLKSKNIAEFNEKIFSSFNKSSNVFHIFNKN